VVSYEISLSREIKINIKKTVAAAIVLNEIFIATSVTALNIVCVCLSVCLSVCDNILVVVIMQSVRCVCVAVECDGGSRDQLISATSANHDTVH